MFIKILMILILSYISGCATVPEAETIIELSKRERSDLIQSSVECKEKLQSSSNNCTAPFSAIHKMDSNFKYGRFCGKGFPEFIHESGKKEKDLTDNEKLELAKFYYRVTPIDDIDKSCRDHDVCWLLNPNEKLICNEQFTDSMDDLYENMNDQIGFFDVDNTQSRCASLALDMGFTSFAIFEQNSNDKATSTGTSIGRFISSPFTVIYAALFHINGQDDYPYENEICVKDTTQNTSDLP